MIFSLMLTKMFEQAYNTAVTESHGQQGSYSGSRRKCWCKDHSALMLR